MITFWHKYRFSIGLDHLVYIDGEVKAVMTDGRITAITSDYATLETCRRVVAEGAYIEKDLPAKHALKPRNNTIRWTDP